MKFKILAQEKTINQIKKQKQKTCVFSAFVWIATVCTPHPHQPRLLPLTIIVGLFNSLFLTRFPAKKVMEKLFPLP